MSSEQKPSYFSTIATGLVSLIVGVAGGLVLNYLTTESARLEYLVTKSEPFSGDTNKIAIIHLKISNVGRKTLEQLESRISPVHGKLEEYKTGGLPPSSYVTKVENGSVNLKAAHLNPNETLSVQMLVSLASSDKVDPVVEVRAKGIKGIEQESTSGKDVDTQRFPIVLLVASLLAVLTSFLMERIISGVRGDVEDDERLAPFAKTMVKLFSRTSHLDDQREVFAYVLSINGLHDEAEQARSLTRRLTYWSHSDFVAEKCLISEDKEKITSGIKALHDIMHYASISFTSKLLIYVNIARMYAAIGENALAIEALASAREGMHPVILKRIQLDERLTRLNKEVDLANNTT